MIQKVSGKSEKKKKNKKKQKKKTNKNNSFTHLSSKRETPHLKIIQRRFKISKNNKKRSNLISALQIIKNITVCLT